MCGIAGWLDQHTDLSQKYATLMQMSKTLERRGPDEHGEYIRPDAALLHRRLSVIDPEGGKQPMRAEFQGETFIIVYNGELYNTEELKEELRSLGMRFETESDTEVVLKAYCVFKERCAEKLNGIFAFAVYEQLSKRLFLCRDRIGVKPLFFTHQQDRLIFASEIKAILQSGVVAPTVDEEGFNQLFFLSPARKPDSAIFSAIEQLSPGMFAVFEKGTLRKETYFSLKAAPFCLDETQSAERVRFLLVDAVERQLKSDVPLCFFLSGGLDSSIICDTASKFFKRNKLGRIHTYSVEYRDNKQYFEKSLFQPTPDYAFIEKMVNSTDSVHREVILDNSELMFALYPATKARDLPGYVDIDSSLLLFCQEIKRDFTVALSGECADELFAGYPWYHNEAILFEDCFPWSRDLRIRRQVLKKGLLPHGEDFAQQCFRDTVNHTDSLSSDSPRDRRMREMFALNFYWFMQCLLERKDRCSMYSGLEVRVPFCDYRLVELAFNMPFSIKALAGREKGIVRKAFDGILPDEIVWRKKSPYPKTHNPHYLKLCSDKVNEILSDKHRTINFFLDKGGVEDIIAHPNSISSPWYGQLMQAPQILAYLIELDFWLESYGVEIRL